MNTKQLVGIGMAVILAAILLLLPKGVIKNDAPEEEGNMAQSTATDENTEATAAGTDADGHVHENAPLPESSQQLLDDLKEIQAEAENTEIFAIFADSIAQVFAAHGQYDSAAWYAESALQKLPTAERTYRAGLFYFNAFNHVHEGNEQKALAAKAQEYLKASLEETPDRLDAKTKLAMTYVASETPMQGIMMLREVLENDPKNQEALFNLGILSVQTGQFDKAVGRLEKLVAINPQHMQAQFYLAYSYMQLGKKAKARKHFEQVKALDQDPEVLAAVDTYLEELN